MKNDYEELKNKHENLKKEKEKEAGDRKGAEQAEKELARLREEN
jgi:hypothetical protein